MITDQELLGSPAVKAALARPRAKTASAKTTTLPEAVTTLGEKLAHAHMRRRRVQQGLASLAKLANVPVPVADAAQSIWHNPAVMGGLGGAGLGAVTGGALMTDVDPLEGALRGGIAGGAMGAAGGHGLGMVRDAAGSAARKGLESLNKGIVQGADAFGRGVGTGAGESVSSLGDLLEGAMPKAKPSKPHTPKAPAPAPKASKKKAG